MSSIVSDNPILLPTIAQASDAWALASNTVLCGLSIGYLSSRLINMYGGQLSIFNPLSGVIAVCCMVANVALSKLSAEPVESWLPLDQRAVEEIKTYWNESWPMLTGSILYGFILKSLKISVSPPQMVMKHVVNSLKSPWTAFRSLFGVCILGPVLEEIIFRGFVQEKIRNVQVICFGAEAVDATVHKVIRYALVAIAFAAIHYHAYHGLIVNVVILSMIAWSSWLNSARTDRHNGHLWGPIVFHAHCNAGAVLRVCIPSV